VVTVKIGDKAASGGSIIFARLRQSNVHPYLTHCSLDPPDSASHSASRSVQPFLQGSRQRVPIFYNQSPFPPQNYPFAWGSGPHLIHGSCSYPSPQPKRHLDRFSHFRRVTVVTDRPT